jgi:hypothetical protein
MLCKSGVPASLGWSGDLDKSDGLASLGPVGEIEKWRFSGAWAESTGMERVDFQENVKPNYDEAETAAGSPSQYKIRWQ